MRTVTRRRQAGSKLSGKCNVLDFFQKQDGAETRMVTENSLQKALTRNCLRYQKVEKRDLAPQARKQTQQRKYQGKPKQEAKIILAARIVDLIHMHIRIEK